MNAPYHLPAPDFTPAPGWEHLVTATPELALSHAKQVYELTRQEFETAVRGRHPLLTHQETLESNRLITEILSLQSNMTEFLMHGHWASDWTNNSRRGLPEAIRNQIRIPLEVVNAVHGPMPFGACVRAWVDHAIQPIGTQSVSYYSAQADWKTLTAQFRQEPEYPSGFLGIHMGFKPPSIEGTSPPKEDYAHIWDDVTYDPDVGYRAALQMLRINYAGDQSTRDQRFKAAKA